MTSCGMMLFGARPSGKGEELKEKGQNFGDNMDMLIAVFGKSVVMLSSASTSQSLNFP